MTAGFVYVLVNSSMPGLVKVGKTSRPPSERAEELSGVTGVPTPFVLVFEQFFSDCDLAEDYVHAELERRGLRQAQNREFFRAASSDVIRIILETPSFANGLDTAQETRDDEDADLLVSPGASDDEQPPEGQRPRKPWDGLLEEADAHYYGHGDTIQDYKEALELYKHAARLGSLVAYERIGDIYASGQGVAEDEQKALQFYRSGAKRGSYYCYHGMAELFEAQGHDENSHKAWKAFFDGRAASPGSDDTEGEEEDLKYGGACADYVIWQLRWGRQIDFLDMIRPCAQEICMALTHRITIRTDQWSSDDQELDEFDEMIALKWVCDNLLDENPEFRQTLENSLFYESGQLRVYLESKRLSTAPVGEPASPDLNAGPAPQTDHLPAGQRRWWQTLRWWQ